MYKNFAVVRCVNDIEEISFKMPLIKYLPKGYIHNYILKRTPVDVIEIEYFTHKGLEIKLPIITSIIEQEDVEYIKTIVDNFNAMLLNYNINVLILSKELKKYAGYFDAIVSDEKEVQMLFIKETIDKLVDNVEKDLKDIKFAIIAGNNNVTEYVIDTLYSSINSLTIVTSNVENYESKTDSIYEETGLAVDITNKDINQCIDCDIIINCDKSKNKLFYCFNEDSYIIDFYSNDKKIRDIMIKRNDLHIITSTDMYLNNKMINKDLLHGLLLNEHRLLRSMLLYGYRSSMFENVEKIKQQLDIRIGNLYQRNEIKIDDEKQGQ